LRPDPHSFANPAEARVTHVALDLTVDFAARQLRGSAALDVAAAAGAREVVLDTRDLLVRAVTDGAGAALPFTLGEPDPVLGRALTIPLPPGVARVVVEYATGEGAPALQWFAPEQTAGGEHPFLFTQGHAVLTRSWLPTQDSPGVRQTYEARVTVPAALTAVMSAEQRTPDGAAGPPDGGGGGTRRFEFRMPQPVPPYLFALAVGRLDFRPVGPRTGVYAEPPVVERARAEFADLERMLAAAEAIGGPYRWGRFDVLVPPPSFPYGGMENPRLTFVTPTLIAGDRSLTTVVAHELAHAWAGNLVTQATWSDFWLNEGFTVYMELRIVEALYGAERAAMLEVYGRRELDAEVRRLGPASPGTRLHADLAGRDPAEGVTVVPYVKGAAFLRVLERAVGRERLERYLRSWFDRHAFESVTTEEFVRDLRTHLFRGDASLERRVDVERWLYAPGLPENAVEPRSDALDRVEAQARAFAAGGPAESLQTRAWSAQEWRHFLGVLPRELGPERLRDLDAAYHLSASTNAEVLFAWLRLAVRSRYEPALPALERFLTSQGRGKFVRPLYQELVATRWGEGEARRVYRRARPMYHALVRAALDPVIDSPSSNPASP
jgi:leukotriene-A4 hydrolase